MVDQVIQIIMGFTYCIFSTLAISNVLSINIDIAKIRERNEHERIDYAAGHNFNFTAVSRSEGFLDKNSYSHPVAFDLPGSPIAKAAECCLYLRM